MAHECTILAAIVTRPVNDAFKHTPLRVGVGVKLATDIK
jgi:hypothetical protein